MKDKIRSNSIKVGEDSDSALDIKGFLILLITDTCFLILTV